MVAGLVIVPVVSLLTPKPDEALVNNAFACYEAKVLVPQREALGATEDPSPATVAAASPVKHSAKNSTKNSAKGSAKRRKALSD
jgi:hypothetical protein